MKTINLETNKLIASINKTLYQIKGFLFFSFLFVLDAIFTSSTLKGIFLFVGVLAAIAFMFAFVAFVADDFDVCTLEEAIKIFDKSYSIICAILWSIVIVFSAFTSEYNHLIVFTLIVAAISSVVYYNYYTDDNIDER